MDDIVVLLALLLPTDLELIISSLDANLSGISQLNKL